MFANEDYAERATSLYYEIMLDDFLPDSDCFNEDEWFDDEPLYDLDEGFDPYEGCYTYDC